jgi:hypothetical protein
MRRAFVQSHFSTELFSIEAQSGSTGNFDICLLNGTRQLLTLNKYSLLDQLIGQRNRIIVDAPLASVYTSRVRVADIHVFLWYSYYGAVDEREFVVLAKIQDCCLTELLVGSNSLRCFDPFRGSVEPSALKRTLEGRNSDSRLRQEKEKKGKNSHSHTALYSLSPGNQNPRAAIPS